MSPDFRFFVPGTPATKGSTEVKRGRGGRPVVMATNRGSQDAWAGWVAQAARHAWADHTALGELAAAAAPYAGRVEVICRFVLPGPPAGRKTEITRGAGDLDKLERCTWDALTGIVFVDDVQVVESSAAKRTAAPGEMPGCEIAITLLGEATA